MLAQEVALTRLAQPDVAAQEPHVHLALEP